MKVDEFLQKPWAGSKVRFPSVNDSLDQAGGGYRRRGFLKIIGAGASAPALMILRKPRRR